MRKIIDLTCPLGQEYVTVLSGHPAVEYEMIHTHEKNKRTNAWIKFSIHVGTHIDPPYHFDPNGKTIDEIPLDYFIGDAYVAELVGKLEPQAAISVADIKNAGITEEMIHDSYLIIHSGWSEKAYGTPDYYTKNYTLSVELCKWLVENKARGVCMDHPCDPDAHEPFDGTECPAHRALLPNHCLLIECCTNFSALSKKKVELHAIPLKIAHGCGGPARVFAIEED
ncbi:MAG: cyclase family protein [Lachnospiraceae bacterium]|nr:cyclase family protein [Lachnospiraceae bacterium]